MAKSKRSTRTQVKATGRMNKICSMLPEPPRNFGSDVHAERARSIIVSDLKWVNGTILRYFFFNSPSRWKGNTQQKQLVRDAFAAWSDLGIGIEFQEVSSASEAEVRIGFERNDGHWSYLGRSILDFGASERTMNLDKGDAWGIDTAIHEIGHTLGLPHEHQNPKAGIVWDEEKVYAALAAAPNFWDRPTTFHNIISKISADSVQGSSWDPDSIMHYPFEAGLILNPTKYATQPLLPAPGLSTRDKTWVRKFYPPLSASAHKKLRPFESEQFKIDAGEQVNFVVSPAASRKYTFRTFGISDTVMVLFESVAGEPRFLAGDDDSGFDRNASFEVKLEADREYVLRVRLYYQFAAGDTAVMMW